MYNDLVTALPPPLEEVLRHFDASKSLVLCAVVSTIRYLNLKVLRNSLLGNRPCSVWVPMITLYPSL